MKRASLCLVVVAVLAVGGLATGAKENATPQIIDRATIKIDGKLWRAALSRRIVSDDPDADSREELTLIVDAPDGKQITKIIDGRSYGTDTKLARPFLSSLRLRGRDHFLLRLPWLLNYSLATIRLLEVNPAKHSVELVLAADVHADWGGYCKNQDRVFVRADNTDGTHIAVVAEHRHSNRDKDCDTDHPKSGTLDATAFEWRGCYALVPNADHPDGTGSDWDRICIPGRGHVSSNPPDAGAAQLQRRPDGGALLK